MLRVGPAGGERPAAIDPDGRIVGVSSIVSDYSREFFAAGGVARVAAAVAAGQLRSVPDGIRIGAPIARPGKVVCIGISHDVSERAFQLELSHQWDIGKSCETFNPLGPWLVTADEMTAAQDLGLRLSVNGVQRQNGNTADMVFGVAYLIWYLSQYLVLQPGDLINTGTPAGVALDMAEPAYLRPGDRIDLEIDGLGRAAQRMGAA